MTGKYSIGIDLGGTNLRVAAYCEGDAFLETITLPETKRVSLEELQRMLKIE